MILLVLSMLEGKHDMIVLNGKYNHARIMIDHVDEATQSQIISFLNHPAFAKSPIVIMSDCHAGKGAVIGFTMPLRDHVIPNIVGVDLGCGVYSYNLGQQKIKFREFDHFLKEHIPSGHDVHTPETSLIKMIDKELISNTEEVCSRIGEDFERALWSLGTLGGGNHYIELDKDQAENVWLTIHSGSRHFGLAIATFHQRKAKELMIKTFQGASAYNGLEYLPMDLGGKEYLADARVAQQFADTNRTCMAKVLVEGFFDKNLDEIETIKSVHNYIGDDNIIRKGAISAREGERVIIPLNMRDGAIIGLGKGSSKWNYSAPHGAGRKFSRTKAKEKFTLEKFEKEMQGIWSSCVKAKTLDESPMAYKDASDILNNIDETVTVQEIIKPIYNFKAS
jgi:tRNA-splicing ligase RtcB (3'-phosphate/5'-hydroxy nucleic acid ligase)